MSNTFTKTSLRGFTLIELLVVIAIIGLLSTAIMGPVQTGLKKGRDTRKISDLTQVQGALLQYAGDNKGLYPAYLTGLTPTYMATDTKFLSVLQASAATVSAPAARDKFMYVTYTDAASNIVSYHLGSALENQNASLQGDADCSNFANGTGVMPTPDESMDSTGAGVTPPTPANPICASGVGDGVNAKLNNSNYDPSGASAYQPASPAAAVITGNPIDFVGAGTAEGANQVCTSALSTCIFDVVPK